MKKGIAKMNIGADIRQEYEGALQRGGEPADGRSAVYHRTRTLLKDYLGLSGSRSRLL
jgi:hypothetical protein